MAPNQRLEGAVTPKVARRARRIYCARMARDTVPSGRSSSSLEEAMMTQRMRLILCSMGSITLGALVVGIVNYAAFTRSLTTRSRVSTTRRRAGSTRTRQCGASAQETRDT